MNRTAVVLADAPGFELGEYQQYLDDADFVAAADGGARHLLGNRRLPDLVIGDFDSLEPHFLAEFEQDGVTIERHPVRKDETDLELALVRAAATGATTVYVLGALGGRPDQHLANLQLLVHPALAGSDVRVLDRAWEIMAVNAHLTIAGQAGDLVSLLPLSTEVAGIVTEGLFYPLVDESLLLGPARGVSNVLLGTRATVTIRSGKLLVMHQLTAI